MKTAKKRFSRQNHAHKQRRRGLSCHRASSCGVESAFGFSALYGRDGRKVVHRPPFFCIHGHLCAHKAPERDICGQLEGRHSPRIIFPTNSTSTPGLSVKNQNVAPFQIQPHRNLDLRPSSRHDANKTHDDGKDCHKDQ